MNEKMIVNYLQCLINSQSLHLAQFIRKKLVEAYVQIEVKHKFENQALYYLLSMYDHDVDAVIARQRKKMAKQRAQRWREEKELREYISPRTKRVQQQVQPVEGGPVPTTDRRQSLSAMRSSYSSPPRDQRGSPSPEFQPELGKQEGTSTLEISHDLEMNDSYSNHARLDKRALSIPTNLAKQGHQASSPAVGHPDTKLPIGTLPKTRRLPRYLPEKAKTRAALQEPEVKLFNITTTGEEEQSNYVGLVKDKMKVYRALFDRYAQGPAVGQRSLTFEGLRKAKEVVGLP